MRSTTPAGYVPVFCVNLDCKEFVKMGSPQWIGFAKPGSSGGWWCGKCRRHTWADVPKLETLELSARSVVAELVIA